MTRREFIDRAVRDAERELRVPHGWWGTWRDVTDGTVRVSFSAGAWSLSCGGVRISRHDSRVFAIAKARRLSK